MGRSTRTSGARTASTKRWSTGGWTILFVLHAVPNIGTAHSKFVQRALSLKTWMDLSAIDALTAMRPTSNRIILRSVILRNGRGLHQAEFGSRRERPL